MKIVASFDGDSDWSVLALSKIPPLGPQAIVAALQIVAMSCGYFAMDRWFAYSRHVLTRMPDTTSMRTEKQ